MGTKLWLRLLFKSTGKPRKLLRRMLFHSNGKPRRLFRSFILQRDGQVRKPFLRWMSSNEYQRLRRAIRISKTGVEERSASTLSPEAELVLRRITTFRKPLYK